MPSEGNLPLAIHIILHRASGRTLPHCYIETFSLDAAYRVIVERDRTLFGGRTVRVKWERQGELMRDLFSQEDYFASARAANRAKVANDESILTLADTDRLLALCRNAVTTSLLLRRRIVSLKRVLRQTGTESGP